MGFFCASLGEDCSADTVFKGVFRLEKSFGPDRVQKLAFGLDWRQADHSVPNQSL